MARKEEKWFSMRTDFFGRDAYQLGIYNLSAQALAVYVNSIAYCCRWGIDYAFKTHAQHVCKKPAPVVRELVEHGFWFPLPDGSFGVEHEGTLWRRGDPRQRAAIPVRIRALVMERDGYACVECGSTTGLSIDHIWPYSKGGTDEPDNLRVLCQSCNSKKGNRV